MSKHTYAVTHFYNDGFGEIRVLVIDNRPWFFASDVTKALGYHNPIDAVIKHVNHDDKRVVQCSVDSKNRNTSVVSETGLFCLIDSSKLLSSDLFRQWITSDVIPVMQISNQHKISEEQMTLISIIKFQSETISNLAKQLEIYETHVDHTEHKKKNPFDATKSQSTESFDPVGIDVYTFTKKLRDYYGVVFGRKGMFAWLREKGFLYSDRHHRNFPTDQYKNAGWFVIKHKLSDTGYPLYTQTLITPLGEKMLLHELGVDVNS